MMSEEWQAQEQCLSVLITSFASDLVSSSPNHDQNTSCCSSYVNEYATNQQTINYNKKPSSFTPERDQLDNFLLSLLKSRSEKLTFVPVL